MWDIFTSPRLKLLCTDTLLSDLISFPEITVLLQVW